MKLIKKSNGSDSPSKRETIKDLFTITYSQKEKEIGDKWNNSMYKWFIFFAVLAVALIVNFIL